jgi:hypothetical protein
MSRQAFEEIVAIRKCQSYKIECICVPKESQILVGTSDGTLLVYERSRGGEYNMVGQPRKRFSPYQKPITQLIPMLSWNLLLSASETFVSAHALDTLELTRSTETLQASTRGCVLVAASETSSLLFTVVRGASKTGFKLVCTLWNGSSFIDYKEHELKEQPYDLTCAGMDSLCAGFKRSYELINVHTGDKMTIVECGRSGAPPCSVLLPPTKAPQEELLLAVDSPSPRGLFFSLDGRMSRRQNECIQWSASPVALGYVHPYALAAIYSASVKKIEVHNTGTLQCVQSITVGGGPSSITMLPPSCEQRQLAFVTAGGSSVQLLQRVAISEQVHVCLAEGRYEEALTLCELCGDTAGVGQEGLEAIHSKYAFELFAR